MILRTETRLSGLLDVSRGSGFNPAVEFLAEWFERSPIMADERMARRVDVGDALRRAYWTERQSSRVVEYRFP